MKHLIIAMLMSLLCAGPAFGADSGSTSLKESAAIAVKQHPQVKALLHNRDAMSRNLAASLGRFFPSLDLSSKYGFQNYNSAGTRNSGTEDKTNTASDSTLSMTVNVFDGMDRYNSYKGAGDRFESAKHRLEDNIETVALDAVRAHVDVLRNRKLKRMAEENVQSHKEVLNDILERVNVGAGNRADEMQARGRLARAESTVISYTSALESSEAAYVRATGTTPQNLEPVAYTPALLPDDVKKIVAVALEKNPKIKVRKADWNASQRDKNVTESDMYPEVDVVLSSRYTNDLDGAETYVKDNRAMLQFSWNLFNGGSDYNEIKSAGSRVQQAEAELMNETDDLIRQITSGWAEYEAAKGQVEKYEEALQYSIQSRDMYLIQFRVGQRSLLDVLDAINEVFSNMSQLETAKSNRAFSLYKLKTLQGELISTLEIVDMPKS
ncbi:TolC family outer membrane protein [Salidesulfovibrio onnuriiensis]|uniref:TolC family outer membrane protein n=1 Tax=Salidesulfovibrio onnuriiensis TaxID=2583823 RepID=UPI0011C87D00|nr:TolC family outer membrane protein [Salidesulfovibrio onnuriiensis]